MPDSGEGRIQTSWHVPHGVMAGYSDTERQSDWPGKSQLESGDIISPQSQALGWKVPVPALDLTKSSSLENTL